MKLISKIDKLFLKNNYLYFFLFVFFLYSVFVSNLQGIYIYDGYHWGIVASSAVDFINGKVPYEESFIHYGILTTLFHSFFYGLTGSVFSIFFLTSIFYGLSITITCLLIKKFSNNKFCYLFLFITFFLQPFTVFPWHTYLIYFILVFALYIYFYKTFISYFIFGLLIQIIYLTSDSFKICSYLIFLSTILIIYLDFKKNNYLKYILTFSFGFFLPLFSFLIYLNIQGNFHHWINHDISGISIQLSGGSLFKLLNDFFINLFNNFIYKPEYILFIIINISCLIYIFQFIFKKEKNTDLLFISLISIFMNYLLLHKLIAFRIFCSVIMGIIVTFYLLHKTKKLILKEFLLLFLIFITPLSNPFEKGQTNKNYLREYKFDNAISNPDFKHFRFMRFDANVWKHLNFVTDLATKVKNKCNSINSFYNLTSDHYYYLILSEYFENKQIIPGYDETYLKKYYDAYTKIDKNFYSNILIDIKKQNTIFIREDLKYTNLYIQDHEINIDDYSFIELPYSFDNKKKIIFIPKECAKKI